MNHSLLMKTLVVVVLMGCMQLFLADIPKNPYTEHYVQTYSFLKPDCPVGEFDTVTFDPIYQSVNACLATLREYHIGNIYSINSCSKDLAILQTDCDIKCGKCQTRKEIPLNKCVNEKDGTSKITYCGAMKYETIPKMVWQTTHIANGSYANCMANNIAKMEGGRIDKCSKTPFGSYVKRKCGVMFGTLMTETGLYSDSECTQARSLVRQELNKCDDFTQTVDECL